MAKQFAFDPVELTNTTEKRDKHALIAGLLTDETHGIEEASLEHRRETFGWNRFKTIPPKGFLKVFLETFNDTILMILLVAALVQTVLGASIPSERAHGAYIDGIAIWIAVAIVSGVGSFQNYKQDQQFAKINKLRDRIRVKVIRDGENKLIFNDEVVVGDILLVDTGDKIVADGYFLKGFDFTVDESTLTGESEPIKKNEDHPWCFSGTQVTDGSGRLIITAVGERSVWGRTLAMVVGEAVATPLQVRLATLAKQIGIAGSIVGSLCFILLMIWWFVDYEGEYKENGQKYLAYFMFAITLVVLAIPEGLPMAVMITLSYSMRRMMSDHLFVRVLAACETMGGATAICSDKTGTLTENRMTVVEGWIGGSKQEDVVKASMSPKVREMLINNSALNSKAIITRNAQGTVEYVGNRTECALLMFLDSIGEDFQQIRDTIPIKRLFGFNSKKKRSSCIVESGGSCIMYVKGASELILAKCDSYLDADGIVHKLNPEYIKGVEGHISDMASRGLRTIGLAFKDVPPSLDNEDEVDGGLILYAVFGIKDPVRKEVPEAIRQCKSAGIKVRMVTGDNIETAKHIAHECGILSDNSVALEGPEFRAMSYEQLDAIIDRFDVLARSSPEDKYKLVKYLKSRGEVVAVTGDGANDSGALKESDVGLAMGIAGCELAKEASDIVILDDNFASIVRAVLWGRNVFFSIRKFLQFQLAVNVAALSISMVSTLANRGAPLSVLQLMFINLIMDSLGALALVTETPPQSLMRDPPHGRSEPLISRRMFKHIFGIGLTQLVILCLVIFVCPEIDDYYANVDECSISTGTAYTAIADHVAPLDPETVTFTEDDFFDIFLHTVTNFAGQTYEEPKFGCLELSTNGTESVDSVINKLSKFSESVTDRVNMRRHRHVSSFTFNLFMWMQLSNFILCRKLRDERNMFEGLHQAPIFVGVWIMCAAIHLIIMFTPFGSLFKVVPTSGFEWIVCGIGALLMPIVSFILRLIPTPNRATLPEPAKLVSEGDSP